MVDRRSNGLFNFVLSIQPPAYPCGGKVPNLLSGPLVQFVRPLNRGSGVHPVSAPGSWDKITIGRVYRKQILGERTR